MHLDQVSFVGVQHCLGVFIFCKGKSLKYSLSLAVIPRIWLDPGILGQTSSLKSNFISEVDGCIEVYEIQCSAPMAELSILFYTKKNYAYSISRKSLNKK